MKNLIVAPLTMAVLSAIGCGVSDPGSNDRTGAAESALTPVDRDNRADHDTETVLSTFDLLDRGFTTGAGTIKDAWSFGNQGIGAVDYVAGELVFLDGKAYNFTSDGVLHIAGKDEGVSVAQMTTFDPDGSVAIPAGQGFAAMRATMDGEISTQEVIWAIRLHGTFASLTTRAAPKLPCNADGTCPGLTQILTGQIKFVNTNITGTMVGYRHPDAFGKPISPNGIPGAGVNVAGYHFHFVSDDHTVGGHVLDVTTGPGCVAQLDSKQRYTTVLPGGLGKAHKHSDDMYDKDQ